MANAIVYWIHLPEHTDVFSQGYVGYSSKSVEERYSKHVWDATSKGKRNYRLHNTIRKYGSDNLVADVIIVGSEEYCLGMEARLRGAKNIGWNHAIGGSKPPSPLGRKVSEETKKKSSEALKKTIQGYTEEQRLERYAYLKGREFSDETRKKQRDAHLGKQAGWENPKAIKTVWASADVIAEYMHRNPSHGIKKVAKAFKLSEGNIKTLLNKLVDGWEPALNEKWVEFRDSYTSAGGDIFDLETAIYTPNALKKISEESRLMLKAKPWLKHNANLRVWSIADKLFDTFTQDKSLGAQRLGNPFGLQANNLTVALAKLRTGWNPSEDSEWLAFKEQYLLEQESNEISCTTQAP